MRLLYAVLLCFACAPAPRQYMDGAPLRPPVPRTTFTPPGTGLPEYLGPPEAKPDVQPNPGPKRVLPPSMEPGIWASDAPTAHGGPITLLDVTIPIPEVENDAELGNAPVCQWALSDVFKANNGALEKDLQAMWPDFRRCAIIRAWSYCMRVPFGHDTKKWEASERLRARVADPFDKECKTLTNRLTPFSLAFESAIKAWHNNRETTH